MEYSFTNGASISISFISQSSGAISEEKIERSYELGGTEDQKEEVTST